MEATSGGDGIDNGNEGDGGEGGEYGGDNSDRGQGQPLSEENVAAMKLGLVLVLQMAPKKLINRGGGVYGIVWEGCGGLKGGITIGINM